jgi:hypothetical protein
VARRPARDIALPVVVVRHWVFAHLAVLLSRISGLNARAAPKWREASDVRAFARMVSSRAGREASGYANSISCHCEERGDTAISTIVRDGWEIASPTARNDKAGRALKG